MLYDDGDERFYRPKDKTFVVLATPPPAQSGDSAGDESSALSAMDCPPTARRRQLLSTLARPTLDMLAAGALAAEAVESNAPVRLHISGSLT